jgi:hypothetical protein
MDSTYSGSGLFLIGSESTGSNNQETAMPGLVRTALLVLSLTVLGMTPMTAGDLSADLKVGQVWSIRSPSPTTAKVIIGGLEDWHGEAIVHVSMVDVPIPDGAPTAGETTTIDHAPFDRAALASSLGKLLAVGRQPSAEFTSGLASWRAAKGGVWTLGVAEVIAAIFETLKKSTN